MSYAVIDRVQLNDEVVAKLVRRHGGRRVELRPIRPDVYFRSHDAVSLTERELALILDMVTRNT